MSKAKKNLKRKQPAVTFPEWITGVWGRFDSPAGEVRYLETKVSLRFSGAAASGEDRTSELTRFLAPVREVLDIENMDFDQLLQRDLDDNRIVNELIPYILESGRKGTAFFPPIVAVILPVKNKQIQDSYGAVSEDSIVDHPEYEGPWQRESYGTSFSFEHPDEDFAVPHFGIFRWHRDNAQLVVMDGQHRAMALLAIHRTVRDEWSGPGERFAIFYKQRVQELISQLSPSEKPTLIELPVTIVWFPKLTSEVSSVARKLFVDINRNAKLPSPSRILLLSDAELDAFLTRHLLNLLRGDSFDIPIASIEYDYPNDGRKSIGRWSCFTNVEILRELIRWLVYGARQVLDSCDVDVVRKGRRHGMSEEMSLRSELKVAELGEEFDDGERRIQTNKISNVEFPKFNKEKRDALLANFAELHAKPLIALFSHTLPYKAHHEALLELKSEYEERYGVASEAKLCREAIFEGQGAYWTIKRAAETDPKSKLAPTWNLLSERLKNDFQHARRKAYFGSNVEGGKVSQCEAFFEQVRTTAAQGGLTLLFGTIARAGGLHDATQRLKLAEVIAQGISLGIAAGPSRSLTRHLAFSPSSKLSMNKLGRLDPKFAGFWRYFWFELLYAGVGPSGAHKLKVAKGKVQELLKEARSSYIKHLVAVRAKQLARVDPTIDNTEANQRARDAVTEELAEAYSYWFGGTKDQGLALWNAAANADLSPDADSDTEEAESDEYDSEQF